MAEIFLVFLRLGLTSFGGPVAHLGYFRNEFVARRRWLDDRAYADLIALCQFLPGPASSQAGLGIGLMRGGLGGAFAAWLGFTLPSALVMGLAAFGLIAYAEAIPAGMLEGLKAVVVAVVAQALWGMGRSLVPDMPRAAIAVLALATALLLPGITGQLGAIIAGALLGLVFVPPQEKAGEGDLFHAPVSHAVAVTAGILFFALLGALPLLALLHPTLATDIADGFYRSGALVFGGGHVVLPLLQAETVDTGLVAADTFTAGYGAAQAVPGPLFTFAAFLGAAAGLEQTAAPAIAAGLSALALAMIFLPGALLVIACLPAWARLRRNVTARRALGGVNAAVVGILAAALYTPVWTSAIHSIADIAIAAVALVLLMALRVPAWAVVLLGAVAGIAIESSGAIFPR